MRITLGYRAVHDHALHTAADQIAALLTDPRWPWQPQLVRPAQFPQRPLYPWPSGKVPRGKLRETFADIVRSNNTLGINVIASRQDAGNHAWADIDSGQPDYKGSPWAAYPYEARFLCRAADLPAGKRIEDWLEVIHELTVVIGPANGVILADTDERALVSMLYGVGSPRPDMVVDSPRYEIERVNCSRDELGRQYVRPPAWGTYLAPAHVGAIGGRERIVEVVGPPVVRDVGTMLYVQLTERVEDAVSAEAFERRRVFAELLEPITVPRGPVEEAMANKRG